MAIGTGILSPSLSCAQDPAKPDCPPPDMPPIISGAPDLSALNAIMAIPNHEENHTGHALDSDDKAPNLSDYNAAFHFQIYRPKRSVNLGFLGNQYITASVVKEKDLDQVFKQLSADKMIPFNIPEDGCYARAEEMSRLLEKDGITSVKVFVEGRLEVSTPNAPYYDDGAVDWGYHVAPAVLIEKAGKYIPMVIDPSIFDHPVTTDQWVAIQTKTYPHQKPKVYYRDRFTYLPGSPAEDSQPHFLNSDLSDSVSSMDYFASGASDF
jgi:hypothetical protein